MPRIVPTSGAPKLSSPAPNPYLTTLPSTAPMMAPATNRNVLRAWNGLRVAFCWPQQERKRFDDVGYGGNGGVSVLLP